MSKNNSFNKKKRVFEQETAISTPHQSTAIESSSNSKKKKKSQRGDAEGVNELNINNESSNDRLVSSNSQSSEDGEETAWVTATGHPKDMPDHFWSTFDEAGLPDETCQEINRKCTSGTLQELYEMANGYLILKETVNRQNLKLAKLQKALDSLGFATIRSGTANQSDALDATSDQEEVATDNEIVKSSNTVRIVHAGNGSLPALSASGPYARLVLHLEECVATNVSDNRLSYLIPEVRRTMDQLLKAKGAVDICDDGFHWAQYPKAKLAKLIRTNLMESSVSQNIGAAEHLQRLTVIVNIRKRALFNAFQDKANKILEECPFSAPENCSSDVYQTLLKAHNAELTKTLFEVLLKSAKGNSIKGNIILNTRLKAQRPQTPDAWFVLGNKILNEAWRCVEERDQWEQDVVHSAAEGSFKHGDKRSHEQKQKFSGQGNKSQENSSKSYTCDGCGHRSDKPGHKCKFCENHPGRNTSGSWTDSEQFKEIKKRLETLGKATDRPTLHSKLMADGTPLAEKQEPQPREQKFSYKDKKPAKNGELNVLASSNTLRNAIVGDELIECQINICEHVKPVQVLLDTGAKHENFCSEQTAAWIEKVKSIEGRFGSVCRLPSRVENSSALVRLGGTDKKSISRGVVSCNLSFFNEINKNIETINCLRFRIIDTNEQIILGLPTIRQYDLSEKIASFFQKGQTRSTCRICTSAPVQKISEMNTDPCAQLESFSSYRSLCRPCMDEGMDTLKPWFFSRQKAPNIKANHQLCELSSRLSKADLFTSEVLDEDFIDWAEDPFLAESADIPEGRDTRSNQCQFFGSDELQSKIRTLCEEFEEIFSDRVRSEPADVPPMIIEVDKTLWNTNKNRGPPRPQSIVRQRSIEKQVKLYQELNVIKLAPASEYSQVHLVPKSDPNDWRFCIDYIRLNAATVDVQSQPIPNIPMMVHRIGSKKPKVFGVVDLTSGYHQAPLSMAAQVLSAFICFLGIFHWLRVPMGLKNAASYFQRIIATIVLVNLVFVICEVYIDDIFIFGKDEEEFLHNLRLVFERFQKHKITLQPKKCRFGAPELEFVGHVISADGVDYTSEKRQKVLDFPLPSTPKQMLGFLGLANYFREHVEDMTGKTKCLRDMLKDKKKSLIWTDELKEHFYYVRNAVANCQKLFFIDESAEVFVETDASDYGYGAYIYQVINGKQYPILFVSKSFVGAQLNWKVIEKEAYAIYYVLKTYAYLLRDIKFTLRTDHKNLTYINLESSAKVRNWKLFMQEYNFDVEHVAGVDNLVADAFSRLCERKTQDKTQDETQDEDFPEEISFALLGREDEIRIPEDKYRIIGQHQVRVRVRIT